MSEKSMEERLSELERFVGANGVLWKRMYNIEQAVAKLSAAPKEDEGYASMSGNKGWLNEMFEGVPEEKVMAFFGFTNNKKKED